VHHFVLLQGNIIISMEMARKTTGTGSSGDDEETMNVETVTDGAVINSTSGQDSTANLNISALREDSPENVMDKKFIVVPATTGPLSPLSRDLRRRKRRRLFRLLKNSDTLPSFLKAIDAPIRDLGQCHPNQAPPAVDDDDFLLEPPVVVIDVDEYLGFKMKRDVMEDGEQPDTATSGMTVLLPPPVVSSSTTAIVNPADEGWYEGHVNLALPEDLIYLSEIQQWTRQQLEYFSASVEDVHTNQAGRRTPTVRGKVGIRCIHCARAVESQRQTRQAQQQKGTKSSSNRKIPFPTGAVSYPINFAGLYSISIQKPQIHFEKCPYLPAGSRLGALLEKARGDDLERKRMKEGITALMYWTISCYRLGMVETDNGIRFGRDLSLEPLLFETTKAKVEQEHPELVRGQLQTFATNASQYPDRVHSAHVPVAPLVPIEFPKDAMEVLQHAIDEEDDPTERLALREDRHMVSAFMFLTLKQAAICHANATDISGRGKKTRMMRLGLTGFCCRHCKQQYPPDANTAVINAAPGVLQASCRSFSSSSDNLAAAISNSFVLHLLKCPYTPRPIQVALQTLKRYHSRQMQQLPFGSQSRLFSDLWTKMRAMDKKYDPSTLPPQKSVVDSSPPEKEVTEVLIPDGNQSHPSSKELQLPRRGRRPTKSESSPVPERGPNFPVPDDPETLQVLREAEHDWDPSVNDYLILPEDRNLISDNVFLCMRQLKVAIPTDSDFRGNRRDTSLGRRVGLCCIHCAQLPGSHFILPSGRTFPSAPDNMASIFNVSTF
jgi:hypothetical protein